MDNWLGLFILIIAGAAVNLAIAFVVFRALAGAVGVSSEVNTSEKALHSLLTIVPVAGVAGAPFVLLPFIGPIVAFCVSGFVAPMMLAPRYDITQGTAAKIILPTVAVVYVVSAVILYYGLPMVG